MFQGNTAVGEQQLYLLDLAAGTEARPLEGTQGGWTPFFSPDGGSIGFIDEKLTLRRLSLDAEVATDTVSSASVEFGLTTSPVARLIAPGTPRTVHPGCSDTLRPDCTGRL